MQVPTDTREKERGGQGSSRPFFAQRDDRRWLGIACVALLIGILLRSVYALSLHEPQQWVMSDARQYVRQALALAEGANAQRAADAIWPPTTSAMLSLSLLFGGDFRVVQWLMLILSVATIGLTWLFARSFGSRRLAACAVLPAALAVAPIHFTGFFLSEVPGMATVSLALVLSVYGLSLAQSASLLVPGLLMGASWALAATVRPQNLLVGAAAIMLVGFLRWRRFGWQGTGALVLAACGAFCVWLAPFAYRCSVLTGHECLVSGNALFNSVIGFSGDVASVRFVDGTWSPPAKLQHNFEGAAVVGASMYDTPEMLRALAQRIWNHPLDSLVAFVGNGADLFGNYLWLTGESSIPRRYYIVGQQLFLFFVICPALASLVTIRRATLPSRAGQGVVFLCGMLVVVFLVHALSLGESRYRLPYDSVLYVLAASLYTGEIPTVRETSPNRAWTGALILLVGLWIVLAKILVPLPSLRGAAATFQPYDGGSSSAAKTILCSNALPAVGSRWDAPGNTQLVVDHDVVVKFPEAVSWSRVTAALDWNDAYRMRFRRDERVVGERFVMGERPGETGGMTQVDIVTPPTAAREGFDSVIIRVLAGDGKASVGGVLCTGVTKEPAHD